MWDDETKKFYHVDYETAQLGNTTPRSLLRPGTVPKTCHGVPTGNNEAMPENITKRIFGHWLSSLDLE